MNLIYFVKTPLMKFFNVFNSLFDYIKDLIFNLIWNFYLSLDSGAFNATLIMIARFVGTLITYEKDIKIICVPTLSESQLEIDLADQNISTLHSNMDIPNLFPNNLTARLDYLDCIISQKLMRSYFLKGIMYLIYTLYYYLCQKTNFLKFFLLKIINLTYNSGFHKIVSYIIIRTIGGDALMRWAILYGGNPSLSTDSIHSINNLREQESNYPYSNSFNTIYLSEPIDFFENSKISNIECYGVKQIIIIGAGFDSRAIKYSELRAYAWEKMGKSNKNCQLYSRIPVFEVDLRHVQIEKLNSLRKNLPIECLKNKLQDIYFVPCDLRENSLKGQLLKAGVKPNASTLILLEGVTYYLSNEIIAKTFMELHSALCENDYKNNTANNLESSPPRILLYFDYADISFIEFVNKHCNLSLIKQTLKNTSISSCLDSEKLKDSLNDWGWNLIYNWKDKDFSKILYSSGIITSLDNYKLPFNIALCEANFNYKS